jgi:hypothetical protein
LFGVVGIFVRHLDRPGRLVRYFSNASCWMYLTHVALCAWLPGVFARLAAPALVKFSLVLSLSTLLTGGSYTCSSDPPSSASCSMAAAI